MTPAPPLGVHYERAKDLTPISNQGQKKRPQASRNLPPIEFQKAAHLTSCPETGGHKNRQFLGSNKAMPCPSLRTTETLLSCTWCVLLDPQVPSHRIWRHQHLKPIRVCSCHFEVKLSLFFHFSPLTSFLQRRPAPSPLLRVELGKVGARALSLCPAPSRCNRVSLPTEVLGVSFYAYPNT